MRGPDKIERNILPTDGGLRAFSLIKKSADCSADLLFGLDIALTARC